MIPIPLSIDASPCPNCLERRLYVYSTLAPELVKCGACSGVYQLAYVQGYWSGYQSAKDNGHEPAQAEKCAS